MNKRQAANAKRRELIVARFNSDNHTPPQLNTTLEARYAACLTQGMPPLAILDDALAPAGVQQAAMYEAVTAFEQILSGGPCAFCGTAVPRRDPDARNDTTAPNTIWATLDNRPACRPCAYVGTDDLGERVLRTVAGIWGVPDHRDNTRARFHFEVHSPNCKGHAEPWSHVDTKQVREHAAKHYDTSDYATHEREVRAQADLLGLPVYVEQTPPPSKTPPVINWPVPHHQAAIQREWEAEQQRRKAEAEQHERHHLSRLAARDAEDARDQANAARRQLEREAAVAAETQHERHKTDIWKDRKRILRAARKALADPNTPTEQLAAITRELFGGGR